MARLALDAGGLVGVGRFAGNQPYVDVDLILRLHAAADGVDAVEAAQVVECLLGVAQQVTAAQRLHGIHADARAVRSAAGCSHLVARAVGNAHAGHVDQRVNHVHAGVARRIIDRRDAVRGEAHGADQPLGLLLQIKIERLAVALEREHILLLVHEEDRDHVTVEPAAGVIKSSPGTFAVPGIRFGGNQQIGLLLQRKAQRRIGIVQFSRVKQIDALTGGIKDELRAALGGHVLLHGTDGQRAEGKPRYHKAAFTQRNHVHHQA